MAAACSRPPPRAERPGPVTGSAAPRWCPTLAKDLAEDAVRAKDLLRVEVEAAEAAAARALVAVGHRVPFVVR